MSAAVIMEDVNKIVITLLEATIVHVVMDIYLILLTIVMVITISFTLPSALPILIDINECNDSNGGCNQTCTNTPGSYYCECNDGYTIEDKGCIGKTQSVLVIMIMQLIYRY